MPLGSKLGVDAMESTSPVDALTATTAPSKPGLASWSYEKACRFGSKVRSTVSPFLPSSSPVRKKREAVPESPVRSPLWVASSWEVPNWSETKPTMGANEKGMLG